MAVLDYVMPYLGSGPVAISLVVTLVISALMVIVVLSEALGSKKNDGRKRELENFSREITTDRATMFIDYVIMVAIGKLAVSIGSADLKKQMFSHVDVALHREARSRVLHRNLRQRWMALNSKTSSVKSVVILGLDDFARANVGTLAHDSPLTRRYRFLQRCLECLESQEGLEQLRKEALSSVPAVAQIVEFIDIRPSNAVYSVSLYSALFDTCVEELLRRLFKI